MSVSASTSTSTADSTAAKKILIFKSFSESPVNHLWISIRDHLNSDSLFWADVDLAEDLDADLDADVLFKYPALNKLSLRQWLILINLWIYTFVVYYMIIICNCFLPKAFSQSRICHNKIKYYISIFRYEKKRLEPRLDPFNSPTILLNQQRFHISMYGS